MRKSTTLAVLSLFAVSFIVLIARSYLERGPFRSDQGLNVVEQQKETPTDIVDKSPLAKYKPEPTWTPPPVKDPFPHLATSGPPPIPEWNVPAKNLHQKYSLKTAPPLLIGFTRSWPVLLQTVVSYITAGWPPEQIYVVENTGVQQANARGQLSLQNPFYLNHTTLKTLDVNVVQTPVLLSFAQLQNFYLSLSYTRDWPYYFWSHQDVLALSYEDGHDGLTTKAGEQGYRSIYELCLHHLNETVTTDEAWAFRFFAYDHLTMVNPRALEALGGWDTWIPYYMTDCDMHSRIGMANYTIRDLHAGIVTDVSAVLDDLRALYRDPAVKPSFTDPNPPPPPPPPPPEESQPTTSDSAEKGRSAERRADKRGWWGRRAPETKRTVGGGGTLDESSADPLLHSTDLDPHTLGQIAAREGGPTGGLASGPGTKARVWARVPLELEKAEEPTATPAHLTYFRQLQAAADSMFHHKHGSSRGRNTWQASQRGGAGEPFFYAADGFADAFEVFTEAGREVFRRKWGHRDCDLMTSGRKAGDEWRLERDWD